MARLIDAEPILKRWNTESLGRREMYDMVKNAPMVDAVPVVRCKDCRWSIKDDWICGHPNNNAWNISTEHYCGYGERKDND